MANIETKVLTTPTFINGSLHPAGAIVSVDMDQFKPTEDSNPSEGTKNPTPNLADVGGAAVLVPAEIAAIGPTGPAPRAPQQKPAGTLETAEGFTNGGAILIAEGHPEAKEMIEGAMAVNDGVEEEAVQRLNDTEQAAGTAGSGTNGSETGMAPDGEGKPFSGDAFIARGLDDITDDEIAALSPKQLDAVIAAEQDREKPRKGLLTRLGVTE